MGAGLGAGRWGRGRVAGAGRAGGHCRPLGARAQGAAGARRSGRTELVGERQAERASGGARDRRSMRQAGRAAAGARGSAAGTRGAAAGTRGAAAGARGRAAGPREAAGWAASAHLGVLNWARLGFCAP